MLWRIHRVVSTHPAAWNQLRYYGPLAGQRYDPHPPPTDTHAGYAVAYAATDITTAAAEVFQTTRRIRATGEAYLTGWAPARQLRLLDLTGGWALRNGAGYALAMAPRPTCRTWAHIVAATWPDLDGLWVPSTLTGKPMAVLFQPAANSYPTAPEFSRPLNNPHVWTRLQTTAEDIGYTLTPS